MAVMHIIYDSFTDSVTIIRTLVHECVKKGRERERERGRGGGGDGWVGTGGRGGGRKGGEKERQTDKKMSRQKKDTCIQTDKHICIYKYRQMYRYIDIWLYSLFSFK